MNSADRQIDENALAEFETGYISGKPIAISECLRGIADELQMGTLIELVLVEMEFAWKNYKAGDIKPKFLEQYVDEFPLLAKPETLQLLLEEEYHVRKKYGEPIDYKDLGKRFPNLVDSLNFTELSDETYFSDAAVRPQIGSIIDKYTLEEEIGEGGMGRVFAATQTSPVTRQVAVKVIKKGLGSKEVIARFEAERQALAMMDHPNIARILDGGTTAEGQPFFVMEYVQGRSLTEYCDSNKLGLDERLQLFVDVCSAVQHAHQKGIIHRDLKPSNILVADYDGRPVPKVIDFGLAKALDSQKVLTDQTLATHFGQVVGTFKYMSPEQADSSTTDIDTRTDVYALGVVLYELLTGSTPLDQKSFKDKALLKVLELIRDHTPQRPSTKLSSLEMSASEVTDLRKTNPGNLSQILKGDLDWVVMKALEKERQRRYATANGLGEDVKRFLENEPVVARPPSTAYKLRKFVGKNRGFVASIATIATLMCVAVVGTSWFAYQAELAAKSERDQRQIADKKKFEAFEEKQNADEAAKRAQDVLKIVSDSFRSTNPNAGAKITMTAKDVLLNAQKTMVKSELDDLGKIELLETLSTSFRGLGENALFLKVAEQQLGLCRKNFGEDDVRTTNAMNNLGNSYFQSGEHKKALPLFKKIVEIRKRVLGIADPDTLGAMSNLANVTEGIGLLEKALQMREEILELSRQHLGDRSLFTLSAINNMASSYSRQGNVTKTTALLKELVELAEAVHGPDHPTTLLALHNLGVNHAQLGDFPKAIEMLEQVLGRKGIVLGKDHPETLALQVQLSTVYYVSGNLEKSLELGEANLELTKAKLGEEHPETIMSMGNLANVYNRTGKSEQALQMRTKALELGKKVFGDEHVETLGIEMGLANLIDAKGDREKALEIRQRLFEVATRTLGAQHPLTVKVMTGLAGSYMEAGRADEGVELFRKVYEFRKQRLGENHPSTIRSKQNVEMSSKRRDEIEDLQDEEE